MFKCQSTLQKASLQVLSKHAASDMTGTAIDYVSLKPISASDMNWHNVITQSVEVKSLFFRCRLQLKADRWRLSLVTGQGEDKHGLSCFLSSKLRIWEHDLNKVTKSGTGQELGNKQVIYTFVFRSRLLEMTVWDSVLNSKAWSLPNDKPFTSIRISVARVLNLNGIVSDLEGKKRAMSKKVKSLLTSCMRFFFKNTKTMKEVMSLVKKIK